MRHPITTSALAVTIGLSWASATTAREGVPGEPDLLAALCANDDLTVKGDESSCRRALSYPSGQNCDLEINTSVRGEFISGKDIILSSYTSGCEPHVNNWGGTVVFEVTSRDRPVLAGYIVGSVLNGCVVLSESGFTDVLICLSSYMGQGYIESGISQVSLRQNGVNFSIDSKSILDATDSVGAVGYLTVDCSSRIEYFEIGPPRTKLSKSVAVFEVKFADADLIRRTCSLPPLRSEYGTPQPGEAFLDPEVALKADYTFDVATKELRLATSSAEPSVALREPAILPVGAMGKRVALVIGNSAYENVPFLPNAASDAKAIAEQFSRLGFASVQLVLDADRTELVNSLAVFSEEAATSDWAVIYYSGHGLEIGGANYLIPIDATLATDRSVRYEALNLDDVLSATDARKLGLVILDACRDNPFLARMSFRSATRSVTRGLVRVEPSRGTLVAFAAAEGQVAMDGDGEHSPFSTALLRHLGKAGIELNILFRLVRDDVIRDTGGRQEPFVYGTLPAEQFFFVPPPG